MNREETVLSRSWELSFSISWAEKKNMFTVMEESGEFKSVYILLGI